MSEPMMMGSPMSPMSPGAHGQVPSLPAYLMGEHATTPTSPAGRMWSASSGSPAKASFSRSFVASPHQGLDQSAWSESQQRDVMSSHSKGVKTGAPPVAGLLEDLNTSVFTPDHSRLADITNQSMSGTPYASFSKPPVSTSKYGTPSQMNSIHKTPPSPAQRDPFYTQGEVLGADDMLDDTWVTVFGFPPVATSFILQQFSQYGSIIKHIVATDGNWMHMRFQAKLQAKKALSKNGKIFGGTIMVGVIPCIDKLVMQGERDNLDESIVKTSMFHTPGRNTSLPADKLNTSCRNVPIRPLTAAYKAASSDHDVQRSSNTPQKSSNVISKAVEYVFGW